MKNFLPLTSAIAFAGFLFLPYIAEIAGEIAFLVGLTLVLSADYSRRLNPLPTPVTVKRSRESLRLAA